MLNDFFSLLIDHDKMVATISKKDLDSYNPDFSSNQIVDWLSQHKITFGIDENIIDQLSNKLETVEFPVIIAKGEYPKDGHDGYLLNKISTGSAEETATSKIVDFKDILKIPTVKSGQLIATTIPPTPGVPGRDVYGNDKPAKNGKPVQLKPGKNIIFNNGNIFSTIDGQVSISTNSVNVFPIYEVKGDLDMKVGNIDFIGNVEIRGNVPNGFKINAGGDIKIHGLVEGSELIAGGSILVSGGINGGDKGFVKAGMDIHSKYLNHVHCEAEKSIVVDGPILHCYLESGEKIIASNGQVIGGKLSAVTGVEVREIGNIHYTKTEVWLGQQQKHFDQEKQLQDEIISIQENIGKLATLKAKLDEIERINGSLSSNELLLLEKQRTSQSTLENNLNNLLEEQKLLTSNVSELDSTLIVTGTIHPNTEVHFGKYSKLFQQTFSNSKVSLYHGEITTTPII